MVLKFLFFEEKMPLCAVLKIEDLCLQSKLVVIVAAFDMSGKTELIFSHELLITISLVKI